MYDRDRESARTLINAAIIVQSVFTGIFVVAMIFVLAATSFSANPPGALGMAIIAMITIIGTAFALLWILLDYFLLYRKIVEDRLEEIESTALVLGIIQLIFGGVVAGILILVAHGRISSSINYRIRSGGSNSPGSP